MNKQTATCWVFPILVCIIVFGILFTIFSGKPVTGIIVGLGAGFLLSCITLGAEEAVYGSGEGGVLIDLGHGYTPDEEVDSLIKVPFYFFLIWVNFLVDVGIKLLVFLLSTVLL